MRSPSFYLHSFSYLYTTYTISIFHICIFLDIFYTLWRLCIDNKEYYPVGSLHRSPSLAQLEYEPQWSIYVAIYGKWLLATLV